MAAQSCTDRTWTPPPGCCLDGGEPTSNGSSQPRLVLYNSYLDRKVPFVPAAGPDSKQVRGRVDAGRQGAQWAGGGGRVLGAMLGL